MKIMLLTRRAITFRMWRRSKIHIRIGQVQLINSKKELKK